MKLRPYEQMEQSGAEWLGSIPSHWTVRRLGYFFSERREIGADSEFPALSVTKGGVVPQLDSAAKSDDVDNRRVVREGDVVINSRSDRKGSSGLAPRDGSVSVVYTVLKPRAGMLGCYAHHLLRSVPFQEEFYRNGKGIVADLWSTRFSDMRSISVPVPPAEEQLRIAAFLDDEFARAASLVAKQRRLAELLQEKMAAVIWERVTKGCRASDKRPSGVSWIGDVPTHWKISPLKRCVRMRSGGTPDKGNESYWGGTIPWASAKDLKVPVLADTQDHLTEYCLNSGAAALVPAGAVLVVVRGMILARTFPVTVAGVPMAINQDLKALIPTGAVESEFLPWLLRAAESETLSRLDEAAHGTKALRMDAWSSMMLPIPPRDEQIEIAGRLEIEVPRLQSLVESAERFSGLVEERVLALAADVLLGRLQVPLRVPENKPRATVAEVS